MLLVFPLGPLFLSWASNNAAVGLFLLCSSDPRLMTIPRSLTPLEQLAPPWSSLLVPWARSSHLGHIFQRMGECAFF